MQTAFVLPPGFVTDDTTFNAPGRWRDGQMVRFYEDNWQVRAGWEQLMLDLLGGVCRAVFPWTDSAAVLNLAFGTHQTLEIWQSGAHVTITPAAASSAPVALPTNAFSTTVGSAVVNVAQPGHGYVAGQQVTIAGAGIVGGLLLNGIWLVTTGLSTDLNNWTFTYPTGLPMALGVNPLKVTSGSAAVTVTQLAHGYLAGQAVVIAGALALGGITPNGTFPVASVIDANTFTYTFSAAATSTATGGGPAVTTALSATATSTATGGGAAATALNDLPGFTPGMIDGTGGAGFGTGAYGVGNYSEPSTVDYFPLTWSFGAFGSWLLANPRNQSIFVWKNVLVAVATALPGAPARVTYMLCTPQRQVMALGCNEEISGVFNPLCIRFSDIEDPTDWVTLPSNNAGEVILPGGGRIVTGRVIGNYVFVWTDRALFLGTFIGSPQQTWRFDKVAENCGAISPGSPVVKNQVAIWIASDAQFYTCPLGGVPTILPCPIRLDFTENITPGQFDKIVGSTVSTWGEITWFYPDVRDGFENSRDITTSPQGWWCRGRLARTAFCDASPQPYPVGVGPGRMAFWHEKGVSQDGAPITGFIESCDFYLNDAAGGVMVGGVWPDFREQQGVFNLTIFTRERAQAPERQHGPYALTPGLGQKCFRVAGRIARLRYDFSSSPCAGRAGKQAFDLQNIGGR